MVRIFSAILVLWLCSLAGCGGESGRPAAPIFYPESKSTFHGVWRGSLDGEIVFESRVLPQQDDIFRDMSCILEFKLFQYNLELKSILGDTVTVYAQTGDWNWKREDPGILVFFNDSTSLEQRWDGHGVSWWSQRSAIVAGTWTCRLNIVEDFNSLTLFGFDKDMSLSEWADSTVLLLTRLE